MDSYYYARQSRIRKACLIVSRALGHNRPEEFQKSYAYKLIAQAN